jgi:hypothetical protein
MKMTSLVCSLTLFATACASDEPTTDGPIEDCTVQQDGSLICERSFPGCTFQPDTAVQFERCGQRNEYVVYGRADGCPKLYYYVEGTFASPAAWEAFVGACERRD